jgi:hypothetical protein
LISFYLFANKTSNFAIGSNIPTRNGAGTSLLVPQLNLFLVAEPSVFTHDGEVLVIKFKNKDHEMDNKRTSKNR